MICKFYDYESFIKQQKETLFNYRFAISDATYNKVLRDNVGDLLYVLVTNRNKFDVCYEDSVTISDNTPIELALAIQYEKMFHPDEVIFVTGDKDMAEMANQYFGQDSIIYTK